MSSKYLGQPFDIHGGGNDLVFPHHENEIAQSEGARECRLARYWLHNGMVNLGSEKMSKSLGNFMTIQQAAEQIGGEALRLLVLGTHYRGPLDFSRDRLEEQKRVLDRIYENLGRADEALEANPAEPDAALAGKLLDAFREGMDDDFNTARGLATLHDAIRAMNRHIDAGAWPATAACRAAIRDIASVLGIGVQDPRSVLEGAKRAGLSATELSPADIERLIEERGAARKSRDFQRADQIRDELKAVGVVLEDTSAGTNWKFER
jgi:cysteinyl-tRNA synthetase